MKVMVECKFWVEPVHLKDFINILNNVHHDIKEGQCCSLPITDLISSGIFSRLRIALVGLILLCYLAMSFYVCVLV